MAVFVSLNRLLLFLFATSYRILPRQGMDALLRLYTMTSRDNPRSIAALNKLDPRLINQLFTMGRENLAMVSGPLDYSLLKTISSKLTFYYGPSDPWTPPTYYQ